MPVLKHCLAERRTNICREYLTDRNSSGLRNSMTGMGRKDQRKQMLLKNIHGNLTGMVTAISRLISAVSDCAFQFCISGCRCLRDRPRSACPERPGASPASPRAPALASLRTFPHPCSGENRRGMLWDVLSASTRTLWATKCHQAPSRMLPGTPGPPPAHSGSSAHTYPLSTR